MTDQPLREAVRDALDIEDDIMGDPSVFEVGGGLLQIVCTPEQFNAAARNLVARERLSEDEAHKEALHLSFGTTYTGELLGAYVTGVETGISVGQSRLLGPTPSEHDDDVGRAVGLLVGALDSVADVLEEGIKSAESEPCGTLPKECSGNVNQSDCTNHCRKVNGCAAPSEQGKEKT